MRRVGGRDHVQVGGDQQRARLWQQPHHALQLVRRRPERFRAAWKTPAVGDEFAVPFEHQPRGREIEPDLLGARVGRRDAARAGELDQRFDRGRGAGGVRGECEQQHAARRFRAREGPRMDLSERRRPQFMWLEAVCADHRNPVYPRLLA